MKPESYLCTYCIKWNNDFAFFRKTEKIKLEIAKTNFKKAGFSFVCLLAMLPSKFFKDYINIDYQK
jgi:hypothetical protein